MLSTLRRGPLGRRPKSALAVAGILVIAGSLTACSTSTDDPKEDVTKVTLEFNNPAANGQATISVTVKNPLDTKQNYAVTVDLQVDRDVDAFKKDQLLGTTVVNVGPVEPGAKATNSAVAVGGQVVKEEVAVEGDGTIKADDIILIVKNVVRTPA